MTFKFRHADKIVGLFTLIAVVLLVFMVIFAGVNKKWFTKKVQFESRFTSAAGLKVGMGVNLRGFEIGRIREISLNDDNQVDIVFFVYETYHDRIRPDSVVALPSSLLGAASALDFYPGLSDGPPLESGSFIPSTQIQEGKQLLKQQRVDIATRGDAITDILNDLPGVLATIGQTVTEIGELSRSLDTGIRGSGDDALSETIRNARDITANVEESTAVLTEITLDIEALTAEPAGLAATLLDPSGSLNTLLNDDDELWNQVMAILAEMETSMAGVSTLANSLAGVSPQLSLTLEETIAALEDARKVMEGLRNNPLLRGGITPENGPVNPGSDLRTEEF